MRRDQFIKTLAALGAASALPQAAHAAANLKLLIPTNPGGGWDTTGRALGKALQDAGVASAVSYDNKGGAAGAIGLAQFLGGSKGDPNALMVMGAVMLGGLISSKSPLQLTQATALARLTTEYNVFVLPAESPLKTIKDVVDQLKKDPGSVKWGGGSRGATEHIAAAMIAREVGVDPSKINYVAFRGGGEAIAAILGGNVTVGGSGYSEFAEYVKTGKMRAIAVTSDTRLAGIDVPTLKEQGVNVVIGNWRGVYGAPGSVARSAQGAHRNDRQGDEEQGLDRSAHAQRLDTGLHGRPRVREVRRQRVRQLARGDGQVRDDLMQATQTATAAGVLVLGASLAAGAAQIPSEAGYAGVGPNFLPWLVAVAMLACGAVLLWQARSKGGFREMELPWGAERGHWPGFVWVSAGILANAALITTIGFILSCTLCFVLARARLQVGRRAARSRRQSLDHRCRNRLCDRRAGVLDVHQAAGDQPARPHRQRLAVRAAS